MISLKREISSKVDNPKKTTIIVKVSYFLKGGWLKEKHTCRNFVVFVKLLKVLPVAHRQKVLEHLY